MDRELDIGYQRKRWARMAAAALLTAAGAGAVYYLAPLALKPSIARARIRTAVVERGPVESAITSTGSVVPEFEQVISSPVNARVLKILKRPGAVLRKGEPIIELDLAESVLALEKINQQIELKQNQQARARLDLQNTLIDLQSKWEIRSLDYKSARAATSRNRALFQQGLISEEKLREFEIAEEKTRFELKQLEETRRTSEQLNQTQVEGLQLEMKTLERERNEARRQLELATTKSDRDGVLTWVIGEEGATVQKGALLARIADLGAFRVEAGVSDVHAGRLAVGLPATVRVSDSVSIAGRVTRINPTVSNGVITAVIGLDEGSSGSLRPNMRVDVQIPTERKERAARLRKGPFATGEGARQVFVVRGQAAFRTAVRLGISDADFFEIVSGLNEGDVVIISDMTDYLYARELKIK